MAKNPTTYSVVLQKSPNKNRQDPDGFSIKMRLRRPSLPVLRSERRTFIRDRSRKRQSCRFIREIEPVLSANLVVNVPLDHFNSFMLEMFLPCFLLLPVGYLGERWYRGSHSYWLLKMVNLWMRWFSLERWLSALLYRVLIFFCTRYLWLE